MTTLTPSQSTLSGRHGPPGHCGTSGHSSRRQQVAAVRKVIRHLQSSSVIFFIVSGVFSGCDYGSNIALNHAIQLVGYGESPQMLIQPIYNCPPRV